MTKQSDRFGNELKQKLDDFRGGVLTLDEIIDFLKEYYSNVITKYIINKNKK